MHRCDYIVENITEYGMFWGLWGMKGVFYMNERRIKLSVTKEVKEFVNTAGLCDFDVDVFYNHFVIDAKSILGVLSLDLNQVLTVKYRGKNAEFEDLLNKYQAC